MIYKLIYSPIQIHNFINNLGDYPLSYKNIEELYSLDIKAVLNLQSELEMKELGVNQGDLMKEFLNYGMIYINYEVIPNSPKDMGIKLYRASKIVNSLV